MLCNSSHNKPDAKNLFDPGFVDSFLPLFLVHILLARYDVPSGHNHPSLTTHISPLFLLRISQLLKATNIYKVVSWSYSGHGQP